MVSVIMPNYNGAIYLAECVNSVLCQTYSEFELIIVDDCSTDNSIEIINDFLFKDKRVKLIKLEENSGRPAVPRNVGLKDSKGDYIAFIDSDDLWHNQKLEIQIEFMKDYNCYFSSTQMKDFAKEIPCLDDKIIRSGLSVEFIDHKKLLFKDIIPTSSVVIDKALFSDILFEEDPKYKVVEDYLCWLKIHQKIRKSLKIRKDLAFYRISGDGLSRSKIAQLKRINMLLSNYSYKGKRLGIKRYFYLVVYICKGCLRVLKKRI